ncbi:MAG TPA: hypothetical protein D7H88_02255 [Candidatus Poseidoniales archaeon]|nr:MAG: hypothetical protein CBE12_02470 [Euryarchaeota archaeon TMED252]DAC08890.1 MAG TPA: hypothetical protein D7H88_02255 [Candidatus Poseidoniales archaeon]HII20022.1 hypothetical protein [Poseidonia sp.]
MQAPLPPPQAAASPYQPPAGAMAKGSMYTFQKWLMIGMILLVFSAVMAQFPLSSSAPNVTDYDLTDEKEADQYLDDVDSYDGQVALFGAFSTILQSGAIVMLGYAFFRESQEDTNQHVAVRITMMLAGVVMVTSIVGRGFSLF